jgi:hypothetical protein
VCDRAADAAAGEQVLDLADRDTGRPRRDAIQQRLAAGGSA